MLSQKSIDMTSKMRIMQFIRRLPSNAFPGVKFQHLIDIGLRQKSLRNLEGKKKEKKYIYRKSRY